MRTHLVICKNPKALELLKEESILIGIASEKGKPMEGGDAMVAREVLQDAGFKWGEDFYLKKVKHNAKR